MKKLRNSIFNKSKVAILAMAISFGSVISGCSSTKNQTTEKETVSTTNNEAVVGVQFFEGSWQEALDLAKKENKLIFLDAYTVWCGPCKMLKARTFPNPELGAFYNKNFINVAMDMERGEGPSVGSKYGVKAYPTLLFIDGKGALVSTALGYRVADDLLKIGKEVIRNKK